MVELGGHRPSKSGVARAETCKTSESVVVAICTCTNGVPAVRFAYVGITSDGRSVEGVVVAATTDHAAVVFDASAPGGELAAVADDLRAMVEHAVIE